MSWIDDLSLDPATDIPNGTEVDNVLWGSNVVQRFLDLAARVRSLSQRVQMVQTSSQTISTGGSWATLTSMSYASANGGVQTVTGMGAISSGLLTMPTGSAGQWAVSGQLTMQGASGLTGFRVAVVKNGNRVIASGAVASASVNLQTASIAAFELPIADGDTIGLQALVAGANTATATFTANDGAGSYLRMQKLP